MKVRGAIFSDSSIRAMQVGRKFQTRRNLTSPLANAEPGDLYYLREAYAVVPTADAAKIGAANTPDPTDPGRAAVYRADRLSFGVRWVLARFMPWWASHYALSVVAKRIERLAT